MNMNKTMADVRSHLKEMGCTEERHGNTFRMSRPGRVLWIKQRDGLLFERDIDPLDDAPYWKRTSAESIIDYFK